MNFPRLRNTNRPAIPAVTRTVIRPLALLDVVRRRGRSWGLLAQYEEARLGLPR
ncbi:hypothetical protein [Candidatus Dactylopiibacterium carminicum]|uniref:hypothetical protein n=1 Tax=Candidatus Dactylopiibacterium carminicum TaxID=857335 RepID=UPI0014831067|nr:hypothetical protein [Candidatus Dactylopiibacterium carminicum]